MASRPRCSPEAGLRSIRDHNKSKYRQPQPLTALNPTQTQPKKLPATVCLRYGWRLDRCSCLLEARTGFIKQQTRLRTRRVGLKRKGGAYAPYLAVFLLEAQPPALFLREVVLDIERDDGARAGKGVRHHGNQRPITQPYDARNIHAAMQRRCFLGGQHRR